MGSGQGRHHSSIPLVTLRVVVVGNSGSGKSSLARWLAGAATCALLDLDTVAWEPGQIAVARDPDAAAGDVRAFARQHDDWVIEGCYADLVGTALEFSPTLLFLNPGERQCAANCRARPWESHKYASQEEQDSRLAFLLTWVSEYYTRSGPMSLAAHRALFDRYEGAKREWLIQPDLATPDPDLLGLLQR